MEQPPTDLTKKEKRRSLQAQLDLALSTLSAARTEKADRSCSGSVAAATSCFGILIGTGLIGCSQETKLPGLFVMGLSIAGFIPAVLAQRFRPAQQEEAEAKIREVGPLVVGSESLRLFDQHRKDLHKLMRTAEPKLAISILQILAAAGNRESLRVVEDATNSFFYPAGRDPEVQQAAREAILPINRRLERAQQSDTLLRPAASKDDQELLRPASFVSDETPEQLLRPYAGDDTDGG